jgi:hypothetical protein
LQGRTHIERMARVVVLHEPNELGPKQIANRGIEDSPPDPHHVAVTLVDAGRDLVRRRPDSHGQLGYLEPLSSRLSQRERKAV